MSRPRFRLVGRVQQPSDHEPAVELMIATIERARKDIAVVERLGDKATPAQVAAKYSAEQFLEECRRDFA